MAGPFDLAPPRDFQPAEDAPGYTLGDVFEASWRNMIYNENVNSEQEALEYAYDDLIRKAEKAGMGYVPPNPFRSGERNTLGATGRFLWRPEGERENAPTAVQAESSEIYQRMLRFEKSYRDGFSRLMDAAEAGTGDLPEDISIESASLHELASAANRMRGIRTQHLSDVLESRDQGFFSADTLASFGGGMAGYFNDPLQVGTLIVGGGPSKTIAGAAIKEAAVNAGVEAALQPGVQTSKLEADVIDTWQQAVGDGLTNVGLAGALGGIFGAGGKTIERTLTGPDRIKADTDFAAAHEALTGLARSYEVDDPETSALVRQAAHEAERDYTTAREKPASVDMEEFADAIENAEAQIRALQHFTERPEPELPPARERLDVSDDTPAPEYNARLSEDGKPVTFRRFDPRSLGVAPDEFQYKRFSGDDGVNEAISDVQTWHAPSSGKVIVYERANGEQVIADGHQRRAKANSIMAKQGREDIRLDGYLYREADGWTIEDVRLKAAQKNIRKGRSDVLDTAQALRENPDAIDGSFPIAKSNVRTAKQLARLSDDAWDLARAEVLEPNHAALIGQVAPDRPQLHGPLARTLVEARPSNIREAENIVSESLIDYAEKDASTQASLFGDDHASRIALYKERAQIMDAAYSWLRSERSVFKALVEKGDVARAIGNELVDAANLNAKDQVEVAIAAVMHARRAGTRTAVNDILSKALDSVRREGVTTRAAGQQVARDIRALVEAKGFKGLIEGGEAKITQPDEGAPLFDAQGSPEHVAQADAVEAAIRPEGRDVPEIDLEGSQKAEREQAAPDGPKDSDSDFVALRRLERTEGAIRDALAELTDAQRVRLIKMQYPDAYPTLNRLAGRELEDAIVAEVLDQKVRFEQLEPDALLFGLNRTEFIDAAKAAFGDAAGAMFRAGDVNLVVTLPPFVTYRRRQIPTPADARAYTDEAGNVTLVSTRFTADEVRGVLLHEIGVHAELRTVLGEDGAQAIFRQLDERLAAGDKTVINARNRVPADTDPELVSEETLAYLVQHAPKHNIVQRLIADVRAWFYKTFPALRDHMTLTEADLVSLAIGAVRSRIREAHAVEYKTSRGATYSVAGVRYARRADGQADNQAGGGALSGEPEPTGRADDAGTGRDRARAGQGGDGGQGPRLARAVASEPLPEPGFVSREWNERIDLSPEQRAQRREQFREFVESTTIKADTAEFLTDYSFANGRRGGKTVKAKTRTYYVEAQPDWDQSWRDALNIEETRIKAEIHGDEATIHDSAVATELRSTGMGLRLYRAAIDHMLSEGKIVNSDVSMSENAIALYKSLRKHGYDVVQRVPDAILERGDDGQFAHPDNSTAIFYIRRKKPQAPEPPKETREMMNEIDEARDLIEHLPACMKGGT